MHCSEKGRMLQLLVVDDEPLLIRAAARALRNKAAITGAHSGDEALRYLHTGSFDAVVAEVSVLDKHGRPFVFEVESSLQQWLPRLIIASGGKDIKVAQYFQKRYGCPLIYKPIDADDLMRKIEKIQARPTYSF